MRKEDMISGLVLTASKEFEAWEEHIRPRLSTIQ